MQHIVTVYSLEGEVGLVSATQVTWKRKILETHSKCAYPNNIE